MRGIPIARKLNEFRLLMIFYTHVAAAHCFRSNYDSAFVYCDKLKELAAKRENKEWEVIALQFYAEVYRKQGKYITATDYYLKALKISEDEGFVFESLSTLIYLSEINRRLGNLETALQYIKQAETAYYKTNQVDYDWKLTSLLNEYAFNYFSGGDLANAFHYALKSDSINNERFVENVCHTNGLLATIYLRQNEYDLALQYAQKSYYWADTLKDRNLYAYSAKILSDVYMAQKRYPEAEAAALKIWMTDSTHIDESRAVAVNIALANIYMHNTERAAWFLKKYEELNAQYAEKSFHTTVSDLGVKYETNKKETRITTLEKERHLYVWLGISGVLLVCSLCVVLFQYIRNARKQRLLIATESLQEGEIRERVRIAEELHDLLGGSLSAMKIRYNNADSLQHFGHDIDECMKEVREITNNIMPRTLRLFGMKAALENLSVEFDNVSFHFFGEDKRIKDNVEYTVYCCARELVTNALKHSNAANINVQLIQNEKDVLLSVHDDGCGFNKATVKKGDGLQNIQKRVAALKGRLYISSSPEKGTEAVLELRMEN
jgi:signal transduction histidine kinase